MQIVHKGLLYDTDNSEEIFLDTRNGKERRYYRTKSKKYFAIYGNGEFAEKTESDVKDIIGSVSYNTYVKVFGKPEEA